MESSLATSRKINEFIDSYRIQCLWYLSKDYYPETNDDRIRLLKQIESHGDRKAFQQAKEFEKWLSQNSKEQSAN
jgi:hypothetical protein